MGLRSQLGSVATFAERWRGVADVLVVYIKEAFPAESQWPAPVPDGAPVNAARTLDERVALARRFADNLPGNVGGSALPLFVDGLGDDGSRAFDAYPFRAYLLDEEGRVAVTSSKGASGFLPTLERAAAWLGTRAAATTDQ
ncbi:MAG: deiodinase-like protein [Acidobacteriota bacterium]